MPDGACVIKYEGKRGVVWRMKYRDAGGRQVKETLGPAPEWDRQKARKALRAKLAAVDEGYKKPTALTFGTFAEEWIETYPDAHSLKRSTRHGYRIIVEHKLVPVLGSLKLEDVNVARVEKYVSDSSASGLGPGTINRHLNVLRLILKAAVKRGIVRQNAVTLADRPREPRRRWRILSPVEIRAVEKAFVEMVGVVEERDERRWLETCRIVFLTTYGAGLRRGELLGLRWKSVRLADPDGATLRVEETFVRGAVETPKSDRGERTIALGSRLAGELFEHRARSAYRGEDERVFCSPLQGTPLNAKRYAIVLRKALAKAKVEGYVRPFHDGRHSSITNAAAAGTSPAALMARAGHSDMQTTLLYVDLAGERFREEAELLERRLWGTSTNSRYQDDTLTAAVEPEIAA